MDGREKLFFKPAGMEGRTPIQVVFTGWIVPENTHEEDSDVVDRLKAELDVKLRHLGVESEVLIINVGTPPWEG